MEVRNATPEELIAEGSITREEVEWMEEFADYVDTHNALPPAKKVTITQVGRPLSFGEPMSFVGVRIPASQRTAIDTYVKRSGGTLSDVIREALDLWSEAHRDQLASA